MNVPAITVALVAGIGATALYMLLWDYIEQRCSPAWLPFFFNVTGPCVSMTVFILAGRLMGGLG